jgi:hypothetical protein
VINVYRVFFPPFIVARGTMIFELRDNVEGNGHTLAAVHVVEK